MYRKKLLLACISILLAFGAAELVVRIFNLGPEIAPVYWDNYRLSGNGRLEYELVPGSKDGDSVMNADGMRDNGRSIEKPAGTFRIACIGDSICYGLEVPREQAFPLRLERILNEYYSNQGTKFEVMNFGVTGYNIKQTIENLKTKALKYQPDMIIYAYCLNEPQEYSFELASLRSLLTDAERQYVDGKSRGMFLVNSRLFLLARYVIRAHSGSGSRKGEAPQLRKDEKIWASLYSGRYPKYFTSLYNDKESWSGIESGLDELADISRSRGIPVWVVVFPVLMHFDKYPLRHIHDKVSEACKKRSFEVVDLLEFFSEYERVNKARVGWDALHPNAEGHGTTAVALFLDITKKEPLSRFGPVRQ